MFGWSTAHGEDDLVPRVEPDVVEEGHGEEEHHEDEPVVHDYVLCKWLNIMETDVMMSNIGPIIQSGPCLIFESLKDEVIVM